MSDKFIKCALISVYDKEGIVDFARKLAKWDVNIIATRSTCELLKDNGIPVVEISDHTGFPEILSGRVKTFHPVIHGGILAVRDQHKEDIEKYKIPIIDLVVVNLYPFEETLEISTDDSHIIETIDIGGSAMIRAAAKNFLEVCVISDPNDYDTLTSCTTTLDYRKKMATRAFCLSARYDSCIANWLIGSEADDFPTFFGHACKAFEFRYGENPHQKAKFYGDLPFEQVQGKDLSYNNMLDVDAAVNLICEFQQPSVAIIKHNNPCAVSSDKCVLEAYLKALASDPISSFGGIVVINRKLEVDLADELLKLFLEVIIVPDISQQARDVLAVKSNLRILVWHSDTIIRHPSKDVRGLLGGIAIQDHNNSSDYQVKNVTSVLPSESVIKDLDFAWKVCKHVRSNAIVVASQFTTLGIGNGQTSRIDSVKIALSKSRDAKTKVLASDAFFPFSDSIELAAAEGVIAIIQPGGSKRDHEVIESAEKHGISMIFTGIRNFCH